MATMLARIFVPTVVFRLFTRYSGGRSKPSGTGLDTLSSLANLV
jgi:hypothetical protein